MYKRTLSCSRGRHRLLCYSLRCNSAFVLREATCLLLASLELFHDDETAVIYVLRVHTRNRGSQWKVVYTFLELVRVGTCVSHVDASLHPRSPLMKKKKKKKKEKKRMRENGREAERGGGSRRYISYARGQARIAKAIGILLFCLSSVSFVSTLGELWEF